LLKTPLGYSIAIIKMIHPESDQIVVIASATGVVKEFYKYFAHYLYDNGLSVITFDYGGIGKSRPISLRNFGTSAQRWATNDLETVLKYVSEHYDDKKLTVIGHSIGGQLIGLAPSSKKITNIVLVAAQSGYYKLWKASERYKMLFAWIVLFPLFNSTLGYIPTKRFTAIEDLPGGMAMEWRKWCLSPNYLFDYVSSDDLYFDKITVPVYSYSTDRDKFATVESTDWLTNKYLNAKLSRIHLKPEEYEVKSIGHFGYFQKKCSHSVWPELLSKIKLT
jgi:predicted alpha/beta hydrolase